MRTKKQVSTLIEENQVDDEMLKYASATSQLKRIEADMEIKIQKIRDKYAPEIEGHRQTQDEAFERLQYFAERHREDLFSKKKSRDYGHGIIGFRIGQWKVTGAGKKALEAIRSFGLPFLRTKEEIDKEKILGQRNDGQVVKQLEGLGISISQDETFYVEVKEEELAGA